MKLINLIDFKNMAFRLFYGYPEKIGGKMNAVTGFANFIHRLATRQDAPDYAIIVGDARGETFRDKLFPAYKEHRKPMPDGLKEQIPCMMNLAKAFGIPYVEAEGYEADDLLATIAKKLDGKMKIQIVSSDKDLHQAVGGTVQILDLMKKECYGAHETFLRFGVMPEQIVDYLALSGDNADGFAGIRYVGKETAVKLLAKYGTAEKIFEKAHEIGGIAGSQLKKPENYERYKFSVQLAKLVTDIPNVGLTISQTAFKPLRKEACVVMKEYGVPENVIERFHKMIDRE